MPILIRIILERLIIVTFATLAFFGINPDLTVPSENIVQERKIEQQQKVEDILSAPEQKKEKESVIKDVEDKITEIQKVFSKTVTEPVIETAKDIIPENLVYEQNSSSFDIKNVVVNVVCLEKTDSFTRLSTGSGVFISSEGLILTNAHVTYPFLKSSQFGSNTYACSVRRENIPNYGYYAELVYYPVDWLKENENIIKDPVPVGTGEDDYALLQVTSSFGPTPKNTLFPYAETSISFSNLKKGMEITVAGYPSSNSGIFEIDAKPGLKSAQTKIVDFFTFNAYSFDVLQTGVNSVAHRGSSGGGIFNKNDLYGIVVTTNSNEEGSYINALTLPYIKKDFENDTGINFENYIKYSADELKTFFNLNFKEEIEKTISEN